MQAHFNLLNHKVIVMARKNYDQYNNVASRLAGLHQDYLDMVSVETTKPTFESHPVLGAVIECSARITIYPTDPLLPDKLKYDGHAIEQLALPNGDGGFLKPLHNAESLYEIAETSAIGRALASAGYVGADGQGKMSFDVVEARERQEAKNKERFEQDAGRETATSTTTMEPTPTLKVVEDKARKELDRRQGQAEKLGEKVEKAKAELEAETAITIPENGAELTPQLWKSWLDAAKIPEDTFPTIPTTNQKISIPKLAQIFQTYQSKPVMKPEVLKAQLTSQYKVTNPRLLTDEQADQLIGEIKGVK